MINGTENQCLHSRPKESSRILKRGEKGSITHKITLNDKDTFYLKYGDAPFLIFSILTLLFGFYQRKNEE